MKKGKTGRIEKWRGPWRRALAAAAVFAAALSLFAWTTALRPARAYDSPAASGAYASYETNEFVTEIRVNKDNTFDYTEHIRVNFLSPKHGIYRYIPIGKDYQVRDVRVEGSEFETSMESGREIVKIGSEDRTVTGVKDYTITYTIAFYEDKDRSADQMYLDVLPSEWETPIQTARVSITLPDDMTWDSLQLYTGSYGSTSTQYGTWDASQEDHHISFVAQGLPANTGATVRAKLPDGYWENAQNRDGSAVWGVGAAALAAVLLLVIRSRSKKENPIVETVEFYPPDGISPADAGFVIDGSVDRRDVTSLLFYLADKGCLTITQTGVGDFTFTNRKEPPDADTEDEAWDFYLGLFQDVPVGGTVRLNDVAEEMGVTYRVIESRVREKFRGEGALYDRFSLVRRIACYMIFTAACGILTGLFLKFWSPFHMFWVGALIGAIIGVSACAGISVARASIQPGADVRRVRSYGSLILGIFLTVLVTMFLPLFFGFVFSAGNVWIISVVMTALAFVTMSAVMRPAGMTEYGASLYGRLLGFRTFIKEAELDKLNELVEQDPDYFYGVLPYAYVFGLTKKWAENFEKLGLSQPDWFDGDISMAGSGAVFAGMENALNTVASTIDDAVSSSMDTGGGDFSGGGFSGGGAGGGGGGAW